MSIHYYALQKFPLLLCLALGSSLAKEESCCQKKQVGEVDYVVTVVVFYLCLKIMSIYYYCSC